MSSFNLLLFVSSKTFLYTCIFYWSVYYIKNNESFNDLLNNNEYNSYVEKNSLYNKNFYSTNNEEITHQSRVTHPAWKYREINYLNHKIEGDYCKGNFCEVPNNFNYLFMNPQENICIPFQNNVSSRILQKDYYNMNNNK